MNPLVLKNTISMEILMTSSIVSLVVHAVMSHRFGVITLSGLCLVDIEKKKD